MAFANEVRDFIDAFTAGAKIKDAYKRRQLDEQEAKDRVTIARDKQAAHDREFKQVYDQNQTKIANAQANAEADRLLKKQGIDQTAAYQQGSLGLRQKEIDSQDSYRKAVTKNAADREARIAKTTADLAAEKARRERIKADPTTEFDPENQPGATSDLSPNTQTETAPAALPTNVTSSSSAPAESEGIPTNTPTVSSDAAQPKAGLPTVPAETDASVGKALQGGLTYLTQHFGLQGGISGASSQQQDGQKRLFEGEGSMTPDEKKAIDQVLDQKDIDNGVDPKQLTAGMRSLRRLTTMYNTFLAKRRPEDANKAAASIIQESRGVASMLGWSALDKLKKGDQGGAINDLIQAHDQIPDGNKVTYDQKSQRFVVTDEQTGDVVAEDKVTPELIFSLANGFKDGSAFYKVVMDAANRDASMQDKKDPNAPKAEKADKSMAPMKPGDYEALGSGTNTTPDQAALKEISLLKLPDDTPVFKEGDDPASVIGADGVEAITELANQIAHYNGLRPEQAGKLAVSIVNPDMNNSDPYNFKMLNTSNEDTMEIVAENGTRLKLPTRTATSMIQRGHAAMMDIVRNSYEGAETDQANSAIRSENFTNQEESAKASAEKAAAKSSGIPVFGGGKTPDPSKSHVLSLKEAESARPTKKFSYKPGEKKLRVMNEPVRRGIEDRDTRIAKR